MTDYRRLNADERVQWGDEIWSDASPTIEPKWEWQPTPRNLVGKYTYGAIVRRKVELMNREPTNEELASAPYPYPLRYIESKVKPLDEKPTREDLTSRECAKLAGSLIAGLIEMADHQTVREAVQWWAENDMAWEALLRMKVALHVANESRAT